MARRGRWLRVRDEVPFRSPNPAKATRPTTGQFLTSSGTDSLRAGMETDPGRRHIFSLPCRPCAAPQPKVYRSSAATRVDTAGRWSQAVDGDCGMKHGQGRGNGASDETDTQNTDVSCIDDGDFHEATITAAVALGPVINRASHWACSLRGPQPRHGLRQCHQSTHVCTTIPSCWGVPNLHQRENSGRQQATLDGPRSRSRFDT